LKYRKFQIYATFMIFEREKMYCPNCKKHINENNKLCPYCGSKIVDETLTTRDLHAYYLASQLKRVANKEILKGVLWFFAGTILTVISGLEYLFWGAMVYGIYRLARGLYWRLNPQALLKKFQKP